MSFHLRKCSFHPSDTLEGFWIGTVADWFGDGSFSVGHGWVGNIARVEHVQRLEYFSEAGAHLGLG